MRTIKIKCWKVQSGEDNIDESVLSVLNALIAKNVGDSCFRGIKKFNTFKRIADAFDKAVDSGTLKLEDEDYFFVKDIIESEIPGYWGTNEELASAIDSFLNAKGDE